MVVVQSTTGSLSKSILIANLLSRIKNESSTLCTIFAIQLPHNFLNVAGMTVVNTNTLV